MSARGHPEQPVTFSTGTVSLAGILHEPAERGPLWGIGIVLVPGGLNRRAGLHRLYVQGARALARRGAAVLRFDLPGVGESGGAVSRVTRARLASLAACHVEETRAALDLLQRETASEAFALLGHCSGGRSGVACAAVDARVRGVATWAMPVGSDDSPTAVAWVREAARRLIERRLPALWVYGTTDPAWSAFEAFLGTLSGAGPAALGAPWTVRTIPSANHDFTSAPWTRAVIEATVEWLVTEGEGRVARTDAPWISA